MRKPSFLWMFGFLLVASCHSTATPETPSSVLPLRTVRLYETGVGYFERTGAASPAEGTALPVPASHLDDALKTLVVLSQGGGARVHGLEFGSSVSKGMARSLAGLPADANTPISYLRLLGSLRGDTVEVNTKDGSVTGRLIDVIEEKLPPRVEDDEEDEDDDEEGDKKKRNAEKDDAPGITVLLLTGESEIRRYRAREIESVRPLNPLAASRLRLALDTTSSRSAQARRMLRVLTEAAGPVTLGYIAETPMWRTTYRLVFGKTGDRGVLQGWALLHNDTDENWSKVQVQLVNGQPDSFLFPLAAPRYTRRGLASPEEPLSTIPQLFDETPDAMWGDFADLEGGGYGGVGQGFGSGHGRLGRSHRSRPPRVRMGATRVRGPSEGQSEMLKIGNLAGIAQAQGVEAGALFTYSLPKPLDLRAHGSALVPFLQTPVNVRRITWVSADGEEARDGVRFANTTKQTLPLGPIAFFASGGFAGESALNRLKPGERQFIQFGADLDVEASVEHKSREELLKKLTFKNDALQVHFVRNTTSVYEIENRSGQKRAVYWPLDVVTNATVRGADEIDFDRGTSKPIAVFRVAPKKKIAREIKAEEGLSRQHRLENLTEETLEKLGKESAFSENERKIVQEAAERRKEYEASLDEQKKVSASIEEVEKDLERLREHLKAMGGEGGPAPAGANPFVRRILAAEDKLSAHRQRVEKLKDEIEERLDAVRSVLRKLEKET